MNEKVSKRDKMMLRWEWDYGWCFPFLQASHYK